MGPTQPTLSAACACAAKVGRSSSDIETTVKIVVVNILFLILNSFLVTLPDLKNKDFVILNHLLELKVPRLAYSQLPVIKLLLSSPPFSLSILF